MKIDMHFHSDKSDWKEKAKEIIQNAKQKKIEAMFLTDHNVVSNNDFVEEAKENGILSWRSVEISACNYNLDRKSVHLTSYSNYYCDKIENLLKKSKLWHKNMLEILVVSLWKNWFEINSEKMFKYFELNWINIHNLNKFFIAKYIYQNRKNREFIKQISWKNLNMIDFYKSFIKREWEHSDNFVVKYPDYELDVGLCWDIVKKVDGVLSIAHPNYTFEKETIEYFKKVLPSYIEQWVNAIEINAFATKKDIEIILEAKKKYGLYLTFWSDCHELWVNDNKHKDLWTLNSLLEPSFIRECFNEYKDKVLI